MKRKLSMLMACLVLLMQVWVPAAVGAETPATAPVELKAIYYADKTEYPSATTQVDTATTDGDSVGGSVRWDGGVFVLTPQTGYTIVSVSNGQEEEQELSTYAEAKECCSNTPEDFATATSGIADTAIAFFWSRTELENSGYYLNITVEDSEGNESTVGYSIDMDWYTSTKTIRLGDSANLLTDFVGSQEGSTATSGEDFASYVTNNILTMDSFDVEVSCCYGYEPEYASSPSDYPTVTPGINGEIDYFMTNKTTGVTYDLRIDVLDPTVDLGMVIKANGQTVSQPEWISESIGYYEVPTISITEEDPVAELTLDVTLPSGMTIDWDADRMDFVENGSTKIEQWNGTDPTEVTYTHSVDSNGHQIFTIDSVNSSNGVCLAFSYNGKHIMKAFFLSVSVEEDVSIDMNGKFGAQNVYVTPYKVYDLADYVDVWSETEGVTDAEAWDIFLERLESGRYEMNIAGGVCLKDNAGHYTGELVFYHSGFRFDIVDTIIGTSITGSDANVIVNKTVAVLAGAKVNIEDLIGDYWDDGMQVEITSGTGFTYDSESHEVTTPSTVSGNYTTAEVVVKTSLYGEYDTTVSTIKINACSEAGYNAAIASIITSDMSDGDNLSINASDITVTDQTKGTELSKDILNALAEKEDATLEVEADADGRGVTWVFDSDNLKTSSKNLMVDVNVETANLKNDATGMQVEFKDNGQLPGETNVRVSLTKAEVKSLGLADTDKQIYLQYYNPTTGKYVQEQSGLTLMADPDQKDMYYIEIPVTHNSTFVITTSASLVGTTSTSTGTNTASTTKTSSSTATTTTSSDGTATTTPALGDVDQTLPWMAVILVGLGIALCPMLRRKETR